MTNSCEKPKGLNVLFIDNFDSFVFSLVDEFTKRDCSVEVWRNDISVSKALEIVHDFEPPRLVVLSPGPGTPGSAGCCMELVRKAPDDLPVFGVCLGFQAIVEAFGGIVGPADEIVHGKTSSIRHDGSWLFKGLPSLFSAGRYHSLVAESVPDSIRVTADVSNMVMAGEHMTKKTAGVQFHPESVLTVQGGLMVQNVIRWAQDVSSCSDELKKDR